jgi:hypothetical protein
MADTVFMNLPTYLRTEDESSYHEYLNQALRQGLSRNGWTVPQLTHNELTAIPVMDPTTGQESPSLAQLMPNGTLWFIIDAVPACYVGKINNSLVKLTTTAYP